MSPPPDSGASVVEVVVVFYPLLKFYSECGIFSLIFSKAMVVSFHPIFKADLNLICAGRDPGPDELAAIRAAQAVVLPQGCTLKLYQMASENCAFVFPNYRSRFQYPGKIGQIKLFRETITPHPKTELFHSTSEFRTRYPSDRYPSFPVVFKFDWGGEGDTVFLLQTPIEFKKIMRNAERYEATGQNGFLLQEYIDSGHRSLRVVVVGDYILSYWRTCRRENKFHANISKGATVDFYSDPAIKRKAENLIVEFCRGTQINLAGLDVVFSKQDPQNQPQLLEINYFFGRMGLGGSEAYYRILRKEIRKWLKRINM